METPRTLTEAIRVYADLDLCLDIVKQMRWPGGVPECPACQGKKLYWLAKVKKYKCAACRKQFSVKVGTIFEDSPLSLDKWFIAMWMVANCRNGISSYEIARDLGITQKSAWFMLHRIRLVMQDDFGGGKLSGEVEVDETFIGGKARNMHAKERKIASGRRHHGKTVVMGMVERGGNVRAEVIQDRNKPILHAQVEKHVEEGSNVFTDELISYWGLEK